MGMKKTKKPQRTVTKAPKCHCTIPEGTAFHMCTDGQNNKKRQEQQRRNRQALANVASALPEGPKGR